MMDHHFESSIQMYFDSVRLLDKPECTNFSFADQHSESERKTDLSCQQRINEKQLLQANKLKCIEQFLIGQNIQQMQSAISAFHELRLDGTECASLKAIILFSSGKEFHKKIPGSLNFCFRQTSHSRPRNNRSDEATSIHCALWLHQAEAIAITIHRRWSPIGAHHMFAVHIATSQREHDWKCILQQFNIAISITQTYCTANLWSVNDGYNERQQELNSITFCDHNSHKDSFHNFACNGCVECARFQTNRIIHFRLHSKHIFSSLISWNENTIKTIVMKTKSHSIGLVGVYNDCNNKFCTD